MARIETSHQNINLRTLRRVDDSIVDIEESALQVAVYKFSASEWERKEIEGTLFVVKRQTSPKYCFVVMNRLNTTNMIESITPQLDLKVQPPYLLYKNDKDEIFCIWFYDEHECKRVGKCMENLIASNSRFNDQNLVSKLAHLGITVMNEPREKNNLTLTTVENTSGHQSGDGNKNDILSLLQKGFNNRQRNDSLSNGANGCSSFESSSGNHTGQKSVDIQHLFATANMMQVKSNPLLLPNAIVHEHQVDHSPWKANNPIEDVLTPELLSKQRVKAVVEDNRSPERSPPIITSQPPLQNTAPVGLYRPTPTPVNINQTMPLTMEQLKQTLIYLLQNDADFLHAIHSAYFNALHK